MSVIERPGPLGPADISPQEPQRFVFQGVDWDFYHYVSDKLPEQRAFITYYKGRLEIVTVGFLHQRLVALISQLIWVLAEESGTEMIDAGMSTLRREDANVALEPDCSFYTGHHEQMRQRKEIDLAHVPPPDLAIEVKVTRRLSERRSIYREIGVPEIWLYNEPAGLTILTRRGDGYAPAEHSPTFPQLAAPELNALIKSGLERGGIAGIKSLRSRLHQV